MTINKKETIDIIYRFILEENIISYKNLKKNFDEYITGLTISLEYINPIEIPTFYSIIDPLLFLGYIEIAYKNDELLFFIPDNKIIKKENLYYKKSDFQPIFISCNESNNFIELNPLKLLRSLQSIETVCNKLEDSNQLEYLYKYNPIDKKIEPYNLTNEKYEVGIYKLQQFSQSDLILQNGKHKRIQRKAINYDELNYCFSYVDIYKKKKIFKYYKNRQELQLYSINIPILIKRALYMCDINNFNISPYSVMEKSTFKNIDNEIIDEIERIFSFNNLEVIDD